MSQLQIDNQSELQLPDRPQQATPGLQESINSLAAYGGMRLLKSLIRDAESLDPRRKAQRNTFLNDALYADERRTMLRQLDIWIDLLSQESTDRISMVEYCEEQIQVAQYNLSENLYSVHELVRPLEVAYRTLDTFFGNVGEGPVNYLDLIDVSRKQLSDLSTPDSQALINELRNNYDAIDLKHSYSLLVMPGYLNEFINDQKRSPRRNEANEQAVGLRGWAKIAHEYKVLLLTDFEDCDEFPELVKRLEFSSLQSPDNEMSNVVMTCNYIMGRIKSDIAEGESDLYIPASAALAGRLCDVEQIQISQGIAGPRFGGINQAPTVRFSLLKSELSFLIDQGVIPFVEVDGRVVAFSNYTLYKGAVPGLREYPVVRVFDWVSKVIQHYCNMNALIVWDAHLRSEMLERLQMFLNQHKGPGKLFENYAIKDIQQDPETKNISVQVSLKPFYAAKDFLIELTGQNETGNMQWSQSILY